LTCPFVSCQIQHGWIMAEGHGFGNHAWNT
jgi:hypothetical protein